MLSDTIKKWFEDEEFAALPTSDKRAAIGGYFDSKVNDEFRGLAPEVQERTRNNFVNTHVESFRPAAPSRSFGGDMVNTAKRAVPGVLEMLLRGVAMHDELADRVAVRGPGLSGGSEEFAPGFDLKKWALDKAGQVADWKEDVAPMSAESQKGGVRGALTQGVESAAVSLGSRAPAMVVGGLVGGPPGVAVGFLTGIPLFGAAQYTEARQRYKDLGWDEQDAEQAARHEAYSEMGWETASSVFDLATLGYGRTLSAPAKGLLKESLETMLSSSWKQAVKKGGLIAAGEGGTELANVATQAEIQRHYEAGTDEMWTAMGKQLGPVGVASVIFGGLGGGLHLANIRQTRKALVEPVPDGLEKKEADRRQQQRVAAVTEVEKAIKSVSPNLARQWRTHADQVVADNAAFDLSAPLEEEAAAAPVDNAMAASGQDATDNALEAERRAEQLEEQRRQRQEKARQVLEAESQAAAGEKAFVEGLVAEQQQAAAAQPDPFQAPAPPLAAGELAPEEMSPAQQMMQGDAAPAQEMTAQAEEEPLRGQQPAQEGAGAVATLTGKKPPAAEAERQAAALDPAADAAVLPGVDPAADAEFVRQLVDGAQQEAQGQAPAEQEPAAQAPSAVTTLTGNADFLKRKEEIERRRREREEREQALTPEEKLKQKQEEREREKALTLLQSKRVDDFPTAAEYLDELKKAREVLARQQVRGDETYIKEADRLIPHWEKKVAAEGESQAVATLAGKKKKAPVADQERETPYGTIEINKSAGTGYQAFIPGPDGHGTALAKNEPLTAWGRTEQESLEKLKGKLAGLEETPEQQGKDQDPAAAAPDAIEPWQVTRDEFIASPPESATRHSEKKEFLAGMHKESVRQALKAGKTVQDQVLADYPDLRPAAPAPAQGAEAAAPEASPSPSPAAATITGKKPAGKKPEVAVSPERLDDDGDIKKAYSGDTLDKGKIRTPFQHDGALYTNIGGLVGGPRLYYDGWKLVPAEEFQEKTFTHQQIVGAYDDTRERGDLRGLLVSHDKKKYVLTEGVRFVPSRQEQKKPAVATITGKKPQESAQDGKKPQEVVPKNDTSPQEPAAQDLPGEPFPGGTDDRLAGLGILQEARLVEIGLDEKAAEVMRVVTDGKFDRLVASVGRLDRETDMPWQAHIIGKDNGGWLPDRLLPEFVFVGRGASLQEALDAVEETLLRQKHPAYTKLTHNYTMEELDKLANHQVRNIALFRKIGKYKTLKIQALKEAIIAANPEGAGQDVPAPETFAPPASRMAGGAFVEADTESGRRVQLRYAVVEAADLVTSHDDGLAVNIEYPAQLQPRERSRDAYRLQVDKISQSPRGAWLGANPKVSEGAPVVTRDMVVLSGNGRSIGLRKAYTGKTALPYRQWLSDHLDQFSIMAGELDGIKQPVLVRVLVDTLSMEELAELAREANASGVSSMSPFEQAMVDAEQLANLDDFAASETGAIDTAANRSFIRRFIGLLPQGEQNAMLDGDGKLSQSGVARIRNAVFALAYPNQQVVARVVESTDNNIRNITNGMLQAAPAIAGMRLAISRGELYNLDITPQLTAAVEDFAGLRAEGVGIEQALAQLNLFGDPRTDLGKQLLRFFDQNSRSGKKINDFLQAYVRRVRAAGNPKQLGLFGQKKTPSIMETLGTAIGLATGNLYEQHQQDLFGIRADRPADQDSGDGGDSAGGTGRGGSGEQQQGSPDRPAAADYGSGNKTFTADAAAKARERLRKKAGRLHSGLDPELLADAIYVAGYHVEAGARKFADFVKAMVADLGEWIEPFLPGLYENIRRYPGFDNAGMSATEEVDGYGSGADRGLERDGADAAAGNGVGQMDNAPGPRGDAEQPGETGDRPAEERPSEQSGDRVPGEPAAAAGEAGYHKLHNQDGKTRPAAGPARGKKPRRGGAADEQGAQAGQGADQPAVDHTEGTLLQLDPAPPADLAERRQQQKKASLLPVSFYSLENIKDSLPFLFPEQQDDVLKAEKRFFEAGGRGMLFTNGTGTGKTYTGLGVARRFFSAGKTEILIVVPKQTKLRDWIVDGENLGLNVRQIMDTKDSGPGILITTYANLYQNEALQARYHDLVIYDESHFISAGKDGDQTAAYIAAHRIAADHPDYLLDKEKLRSKEWRKLLDGVESRRAEILADPQYMFNYKEENRRRTAEYDAWNEASGEATMIEGQLQQQVDARKEFSRTVFLSATPFAHHKSLLYADKYLFDVDEGQPKDSTSRGYNDGGATDRWFMTNLGYRMRYNKLTLPESGVDVGLLERNLHQKLVAAGAVSGRKLDVPFDYSREFVLLDSELGRQIDDGMAIVRGWTDHKENKYQYLPAVVRKLYDYHYVNRLLETLKAREAVARIEKHLALGRKVVVFHDYIEGAPQHPFAFSALSPDSELGKEVARFHAKYPQFAQLDLRGLKPAIDTMAQAFGDRVVFYNGRVPGSKRSENIRRFNEDGSGADVIVVLRAAGKEGDSLHDVTGNHSRVFMDLGLPYSPPAAIQGEGRIYRVGQQSDAIMEYLVLHTSFEQTAYGSKINARVRTVENLAMGDAARDLDTAFKEGYLNAGDQEPGQGQGKGGKASDGNFEGMSDFSRAKTYYYARGKKNQRQKSREGTSYFATPEPVGMKMVEWGQPRPGEVGLEPSAGHGAIARFFPGDTTNHFVEPSGVLAGQLAVNASGVQRDGTFEELDPHNKYDFIIMNPPFNEEGAHGSKLAFDHLAKAVTHLRDGGRIVALLPEGPAADKRLDAFYEKTAGVYLRGTVTLPAVTFERAATKVRTRILIFDKVLDKDQAALLAGQSNYDLSGAEKIEELFSRIEHLEMPARLDAAARPAKPAAAAAGAVTVGRDWHAQKKKEIFTASWEKRLDRETYQKVAAIAKEYGGYWSRFSRKMVFENSREDAEAFAAEVAPLLADDAQGDYNVGEEGVKYEIHYQTAAAAVDAGRRAAGVPDNAVTEQQGAVQLELFAAQGTEGQPAGIQKKEKFESYAKKVGTFRHDLDRVEGREDAAHILAPLAEQSQEVFAGLVLDSDGRPLAVLRHSIGGPESNQVNPGIFAGSVRNVKGAARVWITHNHPSGRLNPSPADVRLTKVFANLFKDTGITLEGHIVMSPAGEASTISLTDGIGLSEGIFPIPGRREGAGKVPVTERRLRGQAANVLSPQGILSSVEMKAALQEYGRGMNGMLLLDPGYRPIKFIPIGQQEMVSLRAGGAQGRAAEIQRELDRLNNATNAGIYLTVSNQAAMDNMARFLRTNAVGLLDVVYGKGQSMADHGLLPILRDHDDIIFFQREEKPAGEKYGPGRETDDTRALERAYQSELRDAFGAGFQLERGTITEVSVSGPDAEAARELAGEFGRKVVFIHNNRLDLLPFGGSVISNVPGVVYINANAAQPKLFVLGHELTHRMELDAPHLYERFRDAVMPMVLAGAWKAYQQRLRSLQIPGEAPFTYPQMISEMLADFMAENFMEKEFWQQVAAREPRLFIRIVNWVKNFLDQILVIFSKNKNKILSETMFADVQAARAAAAEAAAEFLKAEVPGAGLPSQVMGSRSTGPVFFSAMQRHLAVNLPGAGSPASFAQTINSWARSGRIKAEELKWSGLQEWLAGQDQDSRITRAELLTWLDENNLQVEEVDTTVRYMGQQLLPGGDNYRELLFTLPVDQNAEHAARSARINQLIAQRDRIAEQPPSPEQQRQLRNFGIQIDMVMRQSEPKYTIFQSSHWSEPNVLAHVRFNERTGADGKRLLFVEEVQSDWHQAGRRLGYGPAGVPFAPFAGTDKWSMLAMKRMIRWAADHGFDRIGWTTGEQQTDRNNLSRYFKEIAYTVVTAENRNMQAQTIGEYQLEGIDTEGALRNFGAFSAQDLPRVVGKEMADRIVGGAGEESRSRIIGGIKGAKVLAGLDLAVGGEGMKAFYDQILPAAVNRFVKKWGAKVGSGKIKLRDQVVEIHEMVIPPAMQADAMAGFPLFMRAPVTNSPAAVARDLEQDRTFVNRLFAQRDIGQHLASVKTAALQKELQELAGPASRRRHVLGFAYSPLKRSADSDLLDMALMVWRDAQADPDKVEAFRAWAADRLPAAKGEEKIRIKEQLAVLERMDKLTPAQLAFADRIGELFEQSGLVAQANKVIGGFRDNYVRRIWQLPKSKTDDFMSASGPHGFKVFSTAKMHRKFDTILDGWMAGYDLKVKGLTSSYGVYQAELEEILANKDFVRLGYDTRDRQGRRLFSTSRSKEYKDYVELEASGFSVWEWSGDVVAEKAPDDGQVLFVNSHGRKFFYSQVQAVPELWAVHRLGKDGKPVKRAVRLFQQPDAALAWADGRDYPATVQHRPAKDVADAWEKRKLYAPPQLAAIINQATRKDRLFTGTEALQHLLRINASLKSWILLSSFFHHIAGSRSWAFGVDHGWRSTVITDPRTKEKLQTSGVNPVRAYKMGVKKIENLHPIIMRGIKNGLTLGNMQDWDESALRQDLGFSRSLARRLGLERVDAAMEKGSRLRQGMTDSLFKRYFAGLKAEAFTLEYVHELQRAQERFEHGGPVPDVDRIAERVARLINEDFGGLHLQRMGRHPTLQKILRLLLLAPDWTESNFRMVSGLIPGVNGWISRMVGDLQPPAGMRPHYNRFFAKVALRIAVSTFLLQIILNGWDDSEKYWKEQMSGENFYKFRWLYADISKIYQALGIDLEGKRKVFPVGGHFLDPLKLFDPPRLIKGKSSPLMRAGDAVMSGTDWAERPFVGVRDLVTDGKTVKKSPHEEKEGAYDRLPATLVNQVINMQPVQVGYFLKWMQGEEDTLSALLLSAGVGVHNAWPARVTGPVRLAADDPVGAEIERLTRDGHLHMGAPSRTITVGGIPQKMDQAAYEEYVRRSSERVTARLLPLMQSERWQKFSPERQAAIIRDVVISSRKKTRGSIKRRTLRAAVTSSKEGQR